MTNPIDSVENNNIVNDVIVITHNIEPISIVNTESIDDVNVTYEVFSYDTDNESFNIVNNIDLYSYFSIDSVENNNNTVNDVIVITHNIKPISIININNVSPANVFSTHSIAPISITNNNNVSPINVISTHSTASISIANTNNVSNISLLFFKNIGIGSISNTNVVQLERVDNPLKPIDSIVNSSSVSSIGVNNPPIKIPLGKPTLKSNNTYFEKTKFQYSDFNISFLSHPLTGDLGILYDEDSINQSLKNIVFTNKHERPYDDYDISSNIQNYLFELNNSAFLNKEVRDSLYTTIQNYEPRINIIDIIVDSTNKHSIKVDLYYKIRKTDKISKFDFTLKAA